MIQGSWQDTAVLHERVRTLRDEAEAARRSRAGRSAGEGEAAKRSRRRWAARLGLERLGGAHG